MTDKKEIMKQKLKEFKRQLLKAIQTRLRKFLNTEYRTAKEIQQDTMNVYVNTLSRMISPNFMLDKEGGGLYVGEISYIQDKEGKTYFKHQNQKWFFDHNLNDISQDELVKWIAENSYTDDELKVKLGLQTEIDKKLNEKLKDQND